MWKAVEALRASVNSMLIQPVADGVDVLLHLVPI
jgi:hypothetical protein